VRLAGWQMSKIPMIGCALVMLVMCAGKPGGCQIGPAGSRTVAAVGPAGMQSSQAPSELIIETDSDLPDTYPRAYYEIRFRAHGGVPAYRWKLEKGALPPGIRLEVDGLLHGQPERSGEFQFTVSATDSASPPQAVQKGFTLRVRSALSLNWSTPAHVNGNRIEGSVTVSNTMPDDMDLTFVAMAIAENGRGTAIGYQHFVLRRGTQGMELPFGDTLPNGGYVIHVDVVGEVLPKNLIYREYVETPARLQVAVGP
jgi:hypothetical protein